MRRIALLGMVAASVLAGAALIGAARAQEGPGGLAQRQAGQQAAAQADHLRTQMVAAGNLVLLGVAVARQRGDQPGSAGLVHAQGLGQPGDADALPGLT